MGPMSGQGFQARDGGPQGDRRHWALSASLKRIKDRNAEDRGKESRRGKREREGERNVKSIRTVADKAISSSPCNKGVMSVTPTPGPRHPSALLQTRPPGCSWIILRAHGLGIPSLHLIPRRRGWGGGDRSHIVLGVKSRKAESQSVSCPERVNTGQKEVHLRGLC